MYSSLLVPLDRSSLAEQALPFALSIARRANARLDLVEVHGLYALEDTHAGWSPFNPDLDAARKEQEQLYLDATARWATSVAPVSITAALLPGSAVLPSTVVDSILDRACSTGADLIVIATHARGPVSRLGLGSVADELTRRSPVPVLVVRPSTTAPAIIPEPLVSDILIPLDGSALAEQVLKPALDLALLMEAGCSLVRVVESRSSASHEPGPESAEAYLDQVARRVREQGLQVRTRVLLSRHAAEAILEEARAPGSDLIALATHGRGGLKRMLLGSVADKLVRDAGTPVLVYRPAGTHPNSGGS